MDFEIFKRTEKDIFTNRFYIFQKAFREITTNPKYEKMKEKFYNTYLIDDKSKLIYSFIKVHYRKDWENSIIETITLNKRTINKAIKK